MAGEGQATFMGLPCMPLDIMADVPVMTICRSSGGRAVI